LENTQTQNARLVSLDVARGISIFCVILVHTLWMYGSVETQEGWLGDVIHFVGKGTGMFLIAMGFSYMLSRNQSLWLSTKRAFMVLLIGYAMNFFKFVFPILAGVMPVEFIEAYGWTAPLTFDQYLYLIKTGDILQMAGVSLFFMGLINHFVKNKYVVLGIAIMVVVSCRFLQGTHVGQEQVDYFLDILWGSGWNVYFALFPWFAFILVGMFFGKWYLELEKNEGLVFKKMLIAGVALLSIGGGLCFYNFDYHFGDFYHLGPGGAVYLVGFNLLLFYVANRIYRLLKNRPLLNVFVYLSKRVTTLYVIQWVLICWGMYFFGFQQYGTYQVLSIIPLTVAVTLVTQWGLNRVSKG